MFLRMMQNTERKLQEPEKQRTDHISGQTNAINTPATMQENKKRAAQPQSTGGERNYIERFLAIRMELESIGFKYPDYTLHDILKANITPRWREFIQKRYDMAFKETDLPEKRPRRPIKRHSIPNS
ncbi:uncharacterized protein CIMG_13621 [Coccidioides immitis RS]|uniref:Uncharacterized protein n=3 Tax=Coccidioides immitis TaxID=5501 RepID=A0A0D8JVN9_COCIM|nr:uncharacterized protein CIMG_13621 [Coccidioides immitis RS]KJF61395.1 hypothetical protein CIMG_13621 [Coccidioides immitis RS]